MCRSGVPSFSTIDQTMKMLGAKAFWEVFRIFFIFLKEFFEKNHIKGWSSEGQTKLENFKSRKWKIREQWAKMSFVSRSLHAPLKGSVERSLLPWAIFLIFTRNRPWKSEDHLCTLFFFIEMSKERLEKSETTPPVSWRPWALTCSRDRPYNFSCLSAVSKNGRFRIFFLGFGVAFGEEKPFVTSNVSF